MKSNKKFTKALANLLDWSVGNRGSKHCNPYLVPEVKDALKVLAECEGIGTNNYLDVNLKKFTGEK